jgi:hypothetical protein
VFHAGGSVPKRVSAASASPPLGGYEALFWETIKESENPEDFRAYLRQYPQGAFASLAQIRVSALDQKAPDNASRGVGDGRLKVALLPFDGWHGGGKLASVLETMERGISGVVESDSRLQLVYAQHLESARNHPMGDAQRYWEGAPLDKTPKREEVLAAGRALGADIVLTYFFKRNRQGAYVAAYLFDVRSGEILKRELSFEPPATGQAKILTKQLVNELFAKG